MIIVIDTRGSREYSHFINNTVAHLAPSHPADTFITIYGEETGAGNIIVEHPVKKIFSDPVSRTIKKYRGDVLLASRAIRSRTPQCLILVNEPPKKISARQIVVTSFSIKEKIIRNGIDPKMIMVIYPGIDKQVIKIDADERGQMKSAHTDGQEYFFTEGIIGEGIFEMLKAFSIFKKMQKSNMKFVIAAKEKPGEDVLEKLRRYMYSSDVVVVEGNMVRAFRAAAYAAVYPPDEYSFPAAMRSLVPVILPVGDVFKEIAGESALYYQPGDHSSLADKMMMLFKDEVKRTQLATSAVELVKNHTWENAAVMLWNVIENARG